MSEYSGLTSLWRSVPDESTAAFREIFSHVSRAIQLELRDWLPAHYFSVPERYRDKERAFPMLAYRCSRPASLRHGREYTYDLLDATMMHNLFWSLRLRLPKELAGMEAAGLFAGDAALARMYAPRRYLSILQFVRDHLALLGRILAAESALVNALVQFTVALSRTRAPDRACERLLRSWRRALSRIYPDVDASSFLSALLSVATQAMVEALPEEIQRISSEFPGQPSTTSV